MHACHVGSPLFFGRPFSMSTVGPSSLLPFSFFRSAEEPRFRSRESSRLPPRFLSSRDRESERERDLERPRFRLRSRDLDRLELRLLLELRRPIVFAQPRGSQRGRR
jgi:hypothetical protein